MLRLSLTAISAASFLSRANRMIFAIVARLAVAPDGGLSGALRLLDTPAQGGEAGNPALDHVAAQQRQCSDMSLCCTVTHLHCSGWLVATPSSKDRLDLLRRATTTPRHKERAAARMVNQRQAVRVRTVSARVGAQTVAHSLSAYLNQCRPGRGRLLTPRASTCEALSSL
eukprot:2283488-Prymnesium_polylepis.3